MKTSARRRACLANRNGTALVEVAITLPIFFTFVFGLVEYGRLQLVSNMLQAACRNGARLGATEDVTTAAARARVQEILSSAMNPEDVTITVKDASVYDTEGPYPGTPADYDALPDIELDDAQPRQLFLVRASVAYNDVALIPFPVLQGASLFGQSLIRHE